MRRVALFSFFTKKYFLFFAHNIWLNADRIQKSLKNVFILLCCSSSSEPHASIYIVRNVANRRTPHTWDYNATTSRSPYGGNNQRCWLESPHVREQCVLERFTSLKIPLLWNLQNFLSIFDWLTFWCLMINLEACNLLTCRLDVNTTTNPCGHAS